MLLGQPGVVARATICPASCPNFSICANVFPRRSCLAKTMPASNAQLAELLPLHHRQSKSWFRASLLITCSFPNVPTLPKYAPNPNLPRESTTRVSRRLQPGEVRSLHPSPTLADCLPSSWETCDTSAVSLAQAEPICRKPIHQPSSSRPRAQRRPARGQLDSGVAGAVPGSARSDMAAGNAAAGCQLHADLTALAVMWFARALMNLHKFWDLATGPTAISRHRRPDAVVLIDYPGFNWLDARRAKSARHSGVLLHAAADLGLAQWRRQQMRRLADQLLCSLPFEEPWLRRRGATRRLSATRSRRGPPARRRPEVPRRAPKPARAPLWWQSCRARGPRRW